MRIFQKGLIIIAVPLLLELVTTGLLLDQLHKSNLDYARVSRARQLLRAGSDLTLECYDAGFSLSQCCLTFEPLIKSKPNDPFWTPALLAKIRARMAPDAERLRAALDELPKTQDTIRGLVAPYPDEAAAFKPLDDQVAHTYDQLRDIMFRLDAPTTYENCKAIERERNSLNVCVTSLATNLQKIAGKARNIDKNSPAVFAERRQAIKQSLYWALLVNVLMGAALVLYFSRNIVQRLDVLKKNALLLAASKPLLPPIRGNDEISSLDASFHKMAAEIAEADRKERAMLANVRDVICSFDQNMNFLTLSPAAAKLWGYEPEDLVGKSLLEVVAPEDRKRTQSALSSYKSTAATPTALKMESRVQSKDGRIIDTLWSLTGSSVVYGIAYDISERKAVERLKQEFMAMVSHDMRTPLTSILSVQTCLTGGVFGELPPKAGQKLTDATGNVNRLLTLINDLLDLDKLDDGNMPLLAEPVPIRTIVASSISAVEALAYAQNITIHFADCELAVQAEADRIVQVMVNLLSNAIKFSPSGSTISIDVRADAAASDAIIEVTDQGRGIPEAHISSVFERFKQVEKADGTKKKGTGLGLAICKLIVENHGGKLGVTSSEGKGSKFWFSLPLAQKVVTTA